MSSAAKPEAMDEETGADKVPLLAKAPSKELESPQKEQMPRQDMKEAGFWLFMLFIASVTMTVGNKVRCPSVRFLQPWHSSVCRSRSHQSKGHRNECLVCKAPHSSCFWFLFFGLLSSCLGCNYTLLRMDAIG